MRKWKFLRKAVIVSFFIFILNTNYGFSEVKEIILSVIINGEKKGDIFVFIKEKTFYLPIEEMKKMGIKKIDAETIKIDGQDYFILDSWREAKYEFIEEKLELSLTLPPEILPEKLITFYPKRRPGVIIPEQNSFFLNYRFDYSDMEDFSDFYINHELGLRLSDVTLLSTGFFHEKREKYIRLNTSLYYDNRENLTRLILGDFTTPSGPLTYGAPMAGISYFRCFDLDPYFIYRPTFGLTTFTPYRSEVEVYLDSLLIRREVVPPGGVNLSDIYYYGGRRDVTVLIKDPFGRITYIKYPFYFTDLMLKKGLREFFYAVGFLRKDYSVESNRYSNLAFLMMEKYGYTDYLNIGGRFEGVPAYDFYNLTAEAKIMLNKLGVFSFLPSLSKSETGKGWALMGSYSYQEEKLSLRVTGLLSSEQYKNSYLTQDEENKLKRSFSTGISYFMNDFGSLSVDYIHNRYKKEESNTITVGYSKSIGGNITVFANLQKNFGRQHSTSVFAGVTFYPKKDYTLSARYEKSSERTAEVLQASKTPPTGAGYGWRVNLEREKTDAYSYTVNPYFQYKASYGVYEAEGVIRENKNKTHESYRFAFSGAILYTAGHLGFSRPVTDSFALVKASNVENTRVTLNGEVMGKTNKKGYLFLPELSSYNDNIISINDKDIPMEYDIYVKEAFVSPWYKSGFCLEFPVERKYRYSGFLKGKIDEKLIPLEFIDIVIETRARKEEEKNNCIKLVKREVLEYLKVATAKDGEFYIEELNPGNYKAKIVYNGKSSEFELTLPESRELVIELGEIIIPLSKNNNK